MQGASSHGTPPQAYTEHGQLPGWAMPERAGRMPGVCRAVLPLLSSGLDVLGAAGRAGRAGGYTRVVGWRLELRYALWGWNRATKRGNLQEQGLGLRSTGEGRRVPWAGGSPLGRELGHSTAAPRWQRAEGSHPHRAGGMETTTVGTALAPAQPQPCTPGADSSGSRPAPGPGPAVPRGGGETGGAPGDREVAREAGQDGVVGPVSGRGCGTLDGSAESGAEGGSGVPPQRPPTAHRRRLPSASSAPSRLCGGGGGDVRGPSPAR